MAKEKEQKISNNDYDGYIDNFTKLAELYGVVIQKSVENSEQYKAPATLQTMPKIWQEMMAKTLMR